MSRCGDPLCDFDDCRPDASTGSQPIDALLDEMGRAARIRWEASEEYERQKTHMRLVCSDPELLRISCQAGTTIEEFDRERLIAKVWD